MRNSPFPFAPWLPLLFHHVYWDQTEESLCPSLGSRTALAQGPSAHVPLIFGTTICPFSHLQETSQNIPFQLGLSPVDTGVPNWLLMLRNSLSNLVFKHRSDCCSTEPGYTGDIGAIEIWLFDWLKLSLENNDFEFNGNLYLQIWGTAMGRIFPPNYATIFVTQLEEGALSTCDTKPLFYKWMASKWCGWMKPMNSKHSSRVLILTMSQSNCPSKLMKKPSIFWIPQCTRTNFSVKIKPLTLKYTSSPLTPSNCCARHPSTQKHTFKGIIKSQIIRYNRICNNPSYLEATCKTLPSPQTYRLLFKGP